jgi:maltoporin
MRKAAGFYKRSLLRTLLSKRTGVLFMLFFFFLCGTVNAESLDNEIKDLKEQLRLANEKIAALTSRLEAVEARVSAAEEKTAVKAPRGETPAEAGPHPEEEKEKRPFEPARAAFRPTYAHDLEKDAGAMPGEEMQPEDEDVYKSGLKEKYFEAHTTDKLRELEQKFKYYAKGFSFHGYGRSGFGINSKGGDQVAFQAPGAPAKYRLGNETETYGELLFGQNFSPEKGDPFFDVNCRLAFKTLENNPSDPDNDEFSVREIYASMGDFKWAPGVKFWAGERFYRRHDIYIQDYYFLDTSGYGGGFEDLDLFGKGKLSIAYFGGSNDDFQLEDIGSVAKNSFDIRVSDIDVPYGKGMLWLFPSFIKGGTYQNSAGNNEKYNSAGGLAGGAMHIMDAPFGIKGYNKLSVQYGMGTSADFNTTVEDPHPKLKERQTFQITDSGILQPNEHFAMMYTMVYRHHDNGREYDSTIDWFSVGARPIYFFNEHVALAFEAGADHVDSKIDHYNDTLFKMTLAPELRIDNTFMARPVLRAYVTYAVWGDEFTGRVGGDAYRKDKSGLSFGVQMEVWW